MKTRREANTNSEVGSIEVGKLADLVVLDQPYLTIDDEEIKQMKPLLTWWVAA